VIVGGETREELLEMISNRQERINKAVRQLDGLVAYIEIGSQADRLLKEIQSGLRGK